MNAYEVKADMVCLQLKKVCDPCLSASGVRFLRQCYTNLSTLYTGLGGKQLTSPVREHSTGSPLLKLRY